MYSKRKDIKGNSDITNGLPKKAALRKKSEDKDAYLKGKRDAARETEKAMLDAQKQVFQMFETMAMTQMRQMMNDMALQAGQRLTDAEIATYKVQKLLEMMAAPTPPPLGMDPMGGGGAPPPLPVGAEGMGGDPGMPPDLAAMGGGGGAPPLPMAPPDGNAMSPEMMGMPPGGPPMMG